MGNNGIRRTYSALRWLVTIGLAAALIYAALVVIQQQNNQQSSVVINGKTFYVDVAQTQETRQKGLAGREALATNEGMLFAFDKDGDQAIWMKGMKSPIDIVWLDKNKRVVHVKERVQPDNEPHRVYRSPRAARYVLELAAGEVSRAKISAGLVAAFDISGKRK